MQCNNGKQEHKNQGQHNKESVEATVLSRWGKQIEQKSRKQESCQIAHEWNNKQGSIPASFRTNTNEKRLDWKGGNIGRPLTPVHFVHLTNNWCMK